MLTTIWQTFRWHADGILITVEKFRVRTRHNALRFTLVSQITVGLAQARLNKKLSNQFLSHKDCSISQQIQKVFKLKLRKGKVVKVEMMK